MSESNLQVEKTKLKRLVACSRDVIVILIDKDIIYKLVPREFANIFTRYHDSLVNTINEDAYMIKSKIDSTENDIALDRAGLLRDSLNFKYDFFDNLLKIIKMPSLDEYSEADVEGFPLTITPPVTSVAGRIKTFFKRNIKKPKFRKWLVTILSGINNVLGSLATALGGYGEAATEIKHCLEIAMDIKDIHQIRRR